MFKALAIMMALVSALTGTASASTVPPVPVTGGEVIALQHLEAEFAAAGDKIAAGDGGAIALVLLAFFVAIIIGSYVTFGTKDAPPPESPDMQIESNPDPQPGLDEERNLQMPEAEPAPEVP